MRVPPLAIAAIIGAAAALAGRFLLSVEGGDPHGGILHDLWHLALFGAVASAAAPLATRPVDGRAFALAFFAAFGAWLVASLALIVLL